MLTDELRPLPPKGRPKPTARLLLIALLTSMCETELARLGNVKALFGLGGCGLENVLIAAGSVVPLAGGEAVKVGSGEVSTILLVFLSFHDESSCLLQ